MKLTSEQLSDVVIESLTLSVALLERLETMDENGLFAMKAKQSLKNLIPHLENYVNKLIKAHEEDEIEHMQKAATIISELSSRIESALSGNNILDISERKERLLEMIEELPLTDVQRKILYDNITDSGILNY